MNLILIHSKIINFLLLNNKKINLNTNSKILSRITLYLFKFQMIILIYNEIDNFDFDKFQILLF